MTTRRYYEQELAYLRELGSAFGRMNPDIAGLIGASAADPDVERLMEGFAFMTGRLRERMDEQLPELAHGLINMLWPHYLRPVPALTTVEFAAPAAGAADSVPEGAALAARPIEGVTCRFRTAHRLDLVGATVVSAEMEERASSATFVLRLAATKGGSAAALAARPLRLFLHGPREAAPGPQLLHALLRDAEAAEVSDGETTVAAAVAGIRHAGLDEAVLPWPDNAFAGYRVIQEFMAFPERFLFLDLPAVPDAAILKGVALTWRIRLRRRPELPARVSAACVRLNCVPAINLYAADGQPIVPDPGRVEHRVMPQSAHVAARVHSIDDVEGVVQGRAVRAPFPPFASYRHALPGAAGAFYTTRLRPATLGRGAETWIAFVDAGEGAVVPNADAVLLRLTCTDGEIAERLPLGALDQPGIGNPIGLAFRNVTLVTPEASPPLGGDLMWRLVCGLSRSLQPLGDVGALRTLLAAYDMRASQDERASRRLELLLTGLRAIEIAPIEALVKGLPVRGREIRVTVTESGFGDMAGVFLFGAAFDAFLGVYAGLNTCWRLVVTGIETKTELRWPLRAGSTPVP